ncbi:MAG: hypothetical protein GQF41_0223 [Candidatus Rifleibacterium amylolyticum]|nr:MAG: hypothetical protein GQF41_0223 [Candidatus Rifleibacterium amylolyticum]
MPVDDLQSNLKQRMHLRAGAAKIRQYGRISALPWKKIRW